jgi:starch synthase (maltosyl-transferring)
MSGPRIYNLFPPLAGTLPEWELHLPRIAAMDFDWVFVNPFHAPGFSGSLYAVKDYYGLNPLFRGRSREPDVLLLGRFVSAARDNGLNVMMDLVINHTALDSTLVDQHPQWFAHEPDGSVRSPFCVDPDEPDNPEKRTVWGDLAEIDYVHTADRAGLIRYWCDVVRHYTRLGFSGFRCDAAYKVPGEVWGEIIVAAREVDRNVRFFAETLGCQPEEVRQLSGVGFDYLFNSSKWWDFRAPWLLEQYEQFRHIAPSIAFPESHDTKRLSAESGGDERVSRLRYAFAAAFSTGVMMSMGYEYGFRRRMHVVKTRADDWEEPPFVIEDFVTAINRMKARVPLLNEEGPQARLTPEDHPVVALRREGAQSAGKVLTLINPDSSTGHRLGAADAARMLDRPRDALCELTPEHTPDPRAKWLDLPPLAIRFFCNPDAMKGD